MKFIEHQGARGHALGLGTYPMRGDQCYEAVRWALDIGYRHIDTAESYGNEDAVGHALADSGIPRDKISLTTKCAFADATAAGVTAELSASSTCCAPSRPVALPLAPQGDTFGRNSGLPR